MLPAVRSEIRKYFTTRMWWGMGLAVLLTALAFTGLIGYASTHEGESGTGSSVGSATSLVGLYTAGLGIAQLLCLVVGVMFIGGEYRHKTATATFLATPRRWKVVAAKLVALLVIAVCYGAVSIGAGTAIGAFFVHAAGYDPFPDPGFMARSLAFAFLVLLVWAILGLGIGVLVRNQLAAILVAVGLVWIVEPIATLWLITRSWGKGIVKFLPAMATTAVKGGADQLDGVGVELLPWWQAALLLVGYAAVMALVGLLLTVRRDIS